MNTKSFIRYILLPHILLLLKKKPILLVSSLLIFLNIKSIILSPLNRMGYPRTY